VIILIIGEKIWQSVIFSLWCLCVCALVCVCVCVRAHSRAFFFLELFEVDHCRFR